MSSSPTDPAALVDVLMPQLGTSVAEGTILAWSVAVGERVTADATICAISTDKVDSDCPAPATGTLAEILVSEGETVDVGTVIARIAPAADGAASGVPADPPTRRELLRASSPVAARIAAEHGVDVRRLPGTGRGGRVTKRDVLAAVEAGDAPAFPTAHVVGDIPHGAGDIRPADGVADDAPMHTESPYRPDPSIPVVGRAAAPVAGDEAGDAPGADGG
ncbi:biotin/lipoyl-containing protein, partial [Patulibacter sp. S7RM1-6]